MKSVFSAIARVTDWGTARQVAFTYHWEHDGKRYPNHTDTVDLPDITKFTAAGLPAEQQPQFDNDLTLTNPRAIRGVVKFVITSPVHVATDTGSLDIVCHY
jgi:hypothetical protein